jgi:hypothetical protein
MKKRIFVVALLLGGFVFQQASAQAHVSFSVNIATQPVWGPVGYDHVEYYYMPDIDAYYYVPTHQYIYMQHGHWIFASSLPYYYHYNINTGYKVVVNERTPYHHPETYRTRYASYKGRHDQEIIRNSHDERYFENKNHPEHNKWKQSQQGHGNNNQHQQGQGKSNQHQH